MFEAVLPKEKPEDGVAFPPPPKRPPPEAAGVEEDAGADVPGVPLPPKLNDIARGSSEASLNVGKKGDARVKR